MSAHPILILQMQRMGDLVLSFPLFALLRRQYPSHPLWVVGEEQFFVPLMPLSPPVTYFPYSHKEALQKTPFSLVINLSHRAEAAELAGRLRCDELIGPYSRKGTQHIRGLWQLYRASIAHNNRYNRYHWSDLNALDSIPVNSLRAIQWPPVRVRSLSKPCRVGLFLGASEQNKRPDAGFWTGLTRHLLQHGLHPVLLGGKAEMPLGHEVASALGSHALNLCGRFDIRQLYLFIQQLDALVTPDTGPMHIATWAGTQVINLSMGNVSPWETGPMSPGHFIIRGNVPCLDCWQCTRQEVFCKQAFDPVQTGHCIQAMLSSPDNPFIPHSVKGLHSFRSVRHNGLHDLAPLPSTGSQNFLAHENTRQHAAMARFWKVWFGLTLWSMQQKTSHSVATDELIPHGGKRGETRNGISPPKDTQPYTLWTTENCRAAWRALSISHPALARTFSEEGKHLLFALSQAIKTGHNPFMEDVDFWKRFGEPLQPLTGFLQLLVQNSPSVREGFTASLELCEHLLALFNADRPSF